jgi:hypothetical protein
LVSEEAQKSARNSKPPTIKIFQQNRKANEVQQSENVQKPPKFSIN